VDRVSGGETTARSERRTVVGIDIGGTKTAVIAVTLPDVKVVFREVFGPSRPAARRACVANSSRYWPASGPA